MSSSRGRAASALPRSAKFAFPALLVLIATAFQSAPDPVGELERDLTRIIEAPGWRGAEWGVLAVSIDRGDTLFRAGPALDLAPASNMKLVTTAAALESLGPDFRFTTFVMADGPVEDGVLRGDLILYGTGDPSLSNRFYPSHRAALDSLAEQVRALGIVSIEGDVVGDGTYFEGPWIAPDWHPADLNDWFAAPVSALTVNENVISVRVRPASITGLRPSVETVPLTSALDIRNMALTVDGGPSAPLYIGREVAGGPIVVGGQLGRWAADAWREITVSDPDAFAAGMFREALEEVGTEVRGRARAEGGVETSRASRRTIWAPGITGKRAPAVIVTHHSPPLLELVAVVNKRSHNLYAEALFKAVGRIAVGDGSYAGGATAAEIYLTQRVGLPPHSMTIMDGSGLSKTNRASAGSFVRLLEHMSASAEWPGFWESLPEAGNRRELGRMYRTAAAGNLRAKTGTISRVSALSGVVTSASGERIAFSILSNAVPSTSRAKDVEDRIGARLAAFARGVQPDPS